MKPSGKRSFCRPVILAMALLAGPVSAFNLDSDIPIKVSADSARLDDSAGTAVYTGAVELIQGETRLEADRVVLYRNQQGVSRIEWWYCRIRPSVTSRRPCLPILLASLRISSNSHRARI